MTYHGTRCNISFVQKTKDFDNMLTFAENHVLYIFNFNIQIIDIHLWARGEINYSGHLNTFVDFTLPIFEYAHHIVLSDHFHLHNPFSHHTVENNLNIHHPRI